MRDTKMTRVLLGLALAALMFSSVGCIIRERDHYYHYYDDPYYYRH